MVGTFSESSAGAGADGLASFLSFSFSLSTILTTLLLLRSF
jgi:hypothetical protein